MEWNKKFTYPRSTRSLINGSRHYSLDGSNLPSVTTILKVTQSEEDKAAIEAWKQRVGHKEANRIKNEASSRGSSMHAYLEQYLLGKFNLDLLDEEERSKKMANEIIDNGLKDKLSEVWGAEATVYFPGKYAGTADCIGVFKGKPTIIDFKTAKKIKKKDWIEDYFLQGAAYANAHNVMYQTEIESIAILMVDRDLLFKEFLIKNKEFESYTNKWKQRIISYYKTHEILGRE